MEQWQADFIIELGDLNDGRTISPATGDGHKDRIRKGKAVCLGNLHGVVEEELGKILERDGDVILVLEAHTHNSRGPEANERKETITNGIQ